MPSPKKSHSPINVPSILLTEEENLKLFKIMGRRCSTQATAVVQVFLAEPPLYNGWIKKCCGIACFVKDNSRRSYFIRIYDLKNQMAVWEQELYIQFKYYTPLPFFHTFDTDLCPAALNFADQREAQRFQQAIDNKLRQRQMKQISNSQIERSGSINHIITPRHDLANNNIIPLINSSAINRSSSCVAQGKIPKLRKKEVKKSMRLRKTDIGQPTNFQHIQHVGWDPNKGLETEKLDPVLKDLFYKAGVTEKDLQDKETAEFIYDFIDRQGGVEAILSNNNYNSPNSFDNHSTISNRPPQLPHIPQNRVPAQPFIQPCNGFNNQNLPNNFSNNHFNPPFNSNVNMGGNTSSRYNSALPPPPIPSRNIYPNHNSQIGTLGKGPPPPPPPPLSNLPTSTPTGLSSSLGNKGDSDFFRSFDQNVCNNSLYRNDERTAAFNLHNAYNPSNNNIVQPVHPKFSMPNTSNTANKLPNVIPNSQIISSSIINTNNAKTQGLPPPPPPLPTPAKNDIVKSKSPPNLDTNSKNITSNEDKNRCDNKISKNGPKVVEDRSLLMDQIKGGIRLKHIDSLPPPTTRPTNSSSVHSHTLQNRKLPPRSDMLSKINDKNNGHCIKEDKAQDNQPLDGVAGALARALQQRAKVIQSTSDSSENEDFEDEDEWEEE
ncbi:unnamed protein product [Gordionus sp. m RMFG-2023]|uniref:actin nucleation-promoting factor WASL-like n=1 Tax=Gordionus sp. m RMFG-2023 TaxID=3053472 RepID=UPI0030E1F5BE